MLKVLIKKSIKLNNLGGFILGKERIFLASPHMGGLEEVFVKEAFQSNWIAPLGPNVNAFEKK